METEVNVMAKLVVVSNSVHIEWAIPFFQKQVSMRAPHLALTLALVTALVVTLVHLPRNTVVHLNQGMILALTCSFGV